MVDNLGNKHLVYGATLFEHIHADGQTRAETKKVLQDRWAGKDTTNPAFLEPDIEILKWKVTRDGKHGVLEFKLTEGLWKLEEEVVRVLTAHGGIVNNGPAARGERIRELQDKLEGTWDRRGRAGRG